MQQPGSKLSIISDHEKESSMDESLLGSLEVIASDHQTDPTEPISVDSQAIFNASNNIPDIDEASDEYREEISGTTPHSTSLPISRQTIVSRNNNRFHYQTRSGRTMQSSPSPILKLSKKSTTSPAKLAVNLSDVTHHIKTVRFLDASDNLDYGHLKTPAIFAKANPWANIPQFVILTGRNGSGKSQFLQYIHANLATREKRGDAENKEKTPQHKLYEHDILYYRISDNLGNFSTGSHQTDTSYIINNEETFQKTINELQEHYKDKSKKLKSDFSKAVILLINSDLAAGLITDSTIDEKYLRRAIIKTIDYNANDIRLSEPIGYLNYVILQHQKRVAALYSKYNDISNILDLYKYYCTFDAEYLRQFFTKHNILLPVEKPPLEKFLENISTNSTFKKALIEAYTHHSIGHSPLKEINDILQRYGFKYTLINSKDPHSPEVKIIFKNGDKTVESHQLSSGEIMMVSMMAWLFHAQGLVADTKNIRQLKNKVKIMLLDEPDRHLDPQLCKIFFKIVYDEFVKCQKIQVIMTTHRIDTVALIPNPSDASSPDLLTDPHIFVIRHTETATNFVRVTKSHALFRMSSNLRELVGYHHKVYTESARDAKLYEGVYDSLKEKCAYVEQYQAISIDKNRHWLLANGRISRRLLSNRYQLSFYSVSEKDEKGNLNDKGGGTKVIAAIQQDLTALENLASSETLRNNDLANCWKRSRNFLPNPESYCSFGVLDYDYNTDHELKPTTKQHIVITPTRHSVENFLFDPIIFCSSLTEEEIKKCISYSKINFKKEPGEPKRLEDVFTAACFNIKRSLERKDYQYLQSYLDNYFDTIFKIMAAHYKYRPENKKKPEERPIYTNIIKKSLNTIPLCETPIDIIASNNLVFTVLYPHEFLQVRGHDIEEFFWYEKNLEAPAEKVAKEVYNNGLKFIPLDLADIMFNLNERVRNIVVPVIKPYKASTLIAPHAALLSASPKQSTLPQQGSVNSAAPTSLTSSPPIQPP